VQSTREFKNSDKKESSVRYYITSLPKNPEQLEKKIRSHWAIENKLHWILDVAFNEDLNRKRAGNASQNLSLINKIALNTTKNEKSCKLGVKSKRKMAGWSNEYRQTLLSV
jgi:predicted transposase YbfD/YdcC